MNNSLNTRKIVFSALVGAIYVMLTMIFQATSFGPVQFRPSEALTLLPFLFPYTGWGLFVGCALSNFFSQYGFIDIVFGSLATLLAAFLTSRCKNKYLAVLPPVVINALVIGALITYSTPEQSWMPWVFVNVASIAVTELAMCVFLGLPLLYLMERMPFFKKDGLLK